jgi:hypothetical protein
MVRDAGPVEQPGFAVAAVAVDPLRRTLPGDTHLRGDMRDGAGLAAPHQTATAIEGQRGITVTHGRVFPVGGRVGGTSHPAAGRPVPSSQAPPTDTNLMTRNS